MTVDWPNTVILFLLVFFFWFCRQLRLRSWRRRVKEDRLWREIMERKITVLTPLDAKDFSDESFKSVKPPILEEVKPWELFKHPGARP